LGDSRQTTGQHGRAEYKHLVLGLIFLKYVSDIFAARRNELERRFADPADEFFLDDPALVAVELEDRDYYTAVNVFWVPESARWEAIATNTIIALPLYQNLSPMRGVTSFNAGHLRRLIVLWLALAFGPTFAEEQVVTYIFADGRYIELTDSEYFGKTSVTGALMAVDAKVFATTENYSRFDNSDFAVRPWVRNGEWIEIHYLDRGIVRRFHSSEVKSFIVDRPWKIKPMEASSLLAPT
jgi:hypothetical protein